MKPTLSKPTYNELSQLSQTICNEILDSKKNESSTIDKSINDLKIGGFNLDDGDIVSITSILREKQTNTYENVLHQQKPLLLSLCNILNINFFDKNGEELDIESLKKRITNKKHRVSTSEDTTQSDETIPSDETTPSEEIPQTDTKDLP